MTGRGRGRPPKSTPSPTPPPPAAGAPPPVQPTAGGPTPAMLMMGIPSFTTDILNQLPAPKQRDMIALVNRFKSQQIAMHEFLARSRTLLGDRLYAVLAQGMSTAVRMPTGSAGMPMVRPAMPHPQQQQHLQPQQPHNQQQPQDDFNDVTKMDSASLQDVIQYSGVDLRAEAEMMESELQAAGAGYGIGAGMASQDLRMRPDFYFNLARMKAIVYMAAKGRGITTVTDEVFEVIGHALQRRLLNLLTGVSEISKHRVDVARLPFKIKVENDPKKQLWLLEKVYEEQLEREKDSMILPPSANAAKPSADEKAKTAAAKKAGTAADKKSSGEDVIVKTRLANTTAMAALGLQQKSWMTAGIVGLQQQHQQQASAASEGTDPEAVAAEQVKIPLHFSQAPSVTPVTDRDLLLQVSQRTVSMKDLVFLCERDPHLARSPIMLTLYDLSNF